MTVRSITCKWQMAWIIHRCSECREYIYHGHLVWFEDSTAYCYQCGSKRQDDLKEMIRNNTRSEIMIGWENSIMPVKW